MNNYDKKGSFPLQKNDSLNFKHQWMSKLPKDTLKGVVQGKLKCY